MKFSEASENYHPLDYKFDKTGVVNLTEEYNCIHQLLYIQSEHRVVNSARNIGLKHAKGKYINFIDSLNI